MLRTSPFFGGRVDGIPFAGIDTLRVIDKGKKHKKKRHGKKYKKKSFKHFAKLKQKRLKKYYEAKYGHKNKNWDHEAEPVAPAEAAAQPAGLFFFHLDHLGTPQMMTDENGEVVWQADYLPFGRVNVTVDAVENRFRFPGQYSDKGTGLHYNYHRYYDPKAGRYLRPDPSHAKQSQGSSIPYLIPLIMTTPQEFSKYTYARNNPVNRIDPEGLSSCNGSWIKRGWDRLFNYKCVCYWLCVPCSGSILSGPGNYRHLPSTIGDMIYQGGEGLESGDTCFCKKPGPEQNCNEEPASCSQGSLQEKNDFFYGFGVSF